MKKQLNFDSPKRASIYKRSYTSQGNAKKNHNHRPSDHTMEAGSGAFFKFKKSDKKRLALIKARHERGKA